MLQDSVLRGGVHGTHHGANRPDEADSEDYPWIRRHDAERKAILKQSPGNECGDGKSSTCILEALVQVGPLGLRKRIAGFTVQESVSRDDRSSNRCLQATSARHFS